MTRLCKAQRPLTTSFETYPAYCGNLILSLRNLPHADNGLAWRIKLVYGYIKLITESLEPHVLFQLVQMWFGTILWC
jgi:hypothetical protein